MYLMHLIWVMPVTQHYNVIAPRHPRTATPLGAEPESEPSVYPHTAEPLATGLGDGHAPCARSLASPRREADAEWWMRDPWLPGREPDNDEWDELFAEAREAWRGAVHLERESWRGNDEGWRGDEHLADWPEHAAGPEYWMFKGMTDRS